MTNTTYIHITTRDTGIYLLKEGVLEAQIFLIPKITDLQKKTQKQHRSFTITRTKLKAITNRYTGSTTDIILMEKCTILSLKENRVKLMEYENSVN